ncbi:MAG TPA: helix-turn-helix domain-containing protein [Labilithrix sp.]|nr:helix-turn-helix domain-containing protein [Labilithrix sp.]
MTAKGKTASRRKAMPEASPARTAARKRSERQERRRAQSRDDILDAARRVITRDGIRITLDAVAEEVGLTKAALYYYFPSKEALLSELMFGVIKAEADGVAAALATSNSGADALEGIIGTTIARYAGNMADFRLTYMHAQLAAPNALELLPEFFAGLRPLNEKTYGVAAGLIAEEVGDRGTRAGVSPRRLAFLAHMAAIGVLTMKGLVESVGDPLVHSDEQLVADLAKIFATAASPR